MIELSATGKKDERGRELYQIRCADCGLEDNVPFNPDPKRPVYCRACIQKRREQGT